jgi:hypothetical protein
LKGQRLDITDQQYFQMRDVIHSGSLTRIFHGGPDFITKKTEPTYAMALGHAFEFVLEDEACGTQKFDKAFFVVNTDSSIPTDLFGWLTKPDIDLDEAVDATKKKRLTKEGKPNKTYASFFEWIDACRDNPGKIPVSTETMDILNQNVESALAIDMHGTKFRYICENADYQVAFQYQNRVCLVDIFYETDDKVFIWDLKSIGSFGKIKPNISDYWWIQYCHYTDIIRHTFPDKDVIGMDFICASKSVKDDYYARQVLISDPDSSYMWGAYEGLVHDFENWRTTGRQKMGYAERMEVRPWIPQKSGAIYN